MGARLTVQTAGVRNSIGSINVAVYRSDSDFKKENFVYSGKIPASGNGIIQFHNLAPGRYAVAVFHDENENNKLDSNLLGIPKEGYGFSNHATGGITGPPKFSETGFSISGEDIKIDIKLTY
ncbi:MAG: DUF2141 domain-containing protein [Leptospiraceae bacterium]|nr:DUF2141 domain-containing protein [Leptospiraceae bacterium]MCP5513412.1 DUF2141 domain-containing protein [Leptospiraceae bacterium]